MSKDTMADRAAAFIGGTVNLPWPASENEWPMARYLAAFAAREVARVRREQALALASLRGQAAVLAAKRAGGDGHLENIAELIDAATRPDAPPDARTAKSCVVGPTCDHCAEEGADVTDVNHKPVNDPLEATRRRHAGLVVRGDMPMPGKSTGLSALAKQAKKRGAK